MNKLQISFSIAVISLIMVAGSANAQLDRTGDFALLDSDGGFHQLSRYLHRRALVLMSYSRSCQDMDAMLSEYMRLQSRFSEQNIEFLLLDSEGLDREALQALDLTLPILEDSGQLISDALRVTRAGDVRVLNPDRISLFYTGSAGEELQEALTRVVEGTLRSTVRTENNAPCEIHYPVKEAILADVPDYATEVAPFIIENCSSCHKPFGAGPFAIDSYLSLLGWSPMIREVLLNRRMPPAQVDPYMGHSDNARYVSTEDIQTLLYWLEAGAPRGDSASDPLAEQDFAESDVWLLGEPDVVVTAPRQRVPRTGDLGYTYADIELPFEEDTWVRAVQFRPVATSALHHMMAFITGPDEDFWGEEHDNLTSTRRFVDGYSPGKYAATTFEEGTALFIPKGHKLSLQYHFVSIGVEVFDETRVGFYLANEEDELKERLVKAVSSPVVLPPHAHDIPAYAEYVFDEDVVLTGVRARMNARGKNMRFSVKKPDGSAQHILGIPAYNYGWQPHYALREPLALPAGSKVRINGAFDNSVSNPFNPDPSVEVQPGLGYLEEMFTGYLTFYRP